MSMASFSWWRCLGAVLATAGLMDAYAADSMPSSAPAAVPFGTVTHVHGEVKAIGADGSARPLAVGGSLYVGERIQSSEVGEALVKGRDASLVAVRPRTSFTIEGFQAQGKKNDNFVIRIATGSLRLISGWIGKRNRSNYRIHAPNATIGIRGTDHEPYVLDHDLAGEQNWSSGTYDKVNSGATVLMSAGKSVDIAPGKVGFVRGGGAQLPSGGTQKGLMTILLPTLLDKVPGFYVPGRFEAEVEQYARDSAAVQKASFETLKAQQAACVPRKVASEWLKAFDAAIGRKDAQAVVAMFAPEVRVKASVKMPDGSMNTVEVSRDEMVASTLQALSTLSNYRHKRQTLQASAESPDLPCGRVRLKSVVVEQALQGGKPFRFESLEEIVLEQREDAWLAIEAVTTQR